MTAFGSAAAVPHNGALWLVARLLLDAAGGFFGIYLLGAVGLSAAGGAMRWRRRVAMTESHETQ
jgi:hypothetical protein